MSNYLIGYDYVPGEAVWVLNEVSQTIHRGIVTQVNIKIYPIIVVVAVPIPTPNIQIPLIYWILLDNNAGSVKVLPPDIFPTLIDALAALANLVNPNVTPTPTTTNTNTPTPTHTPTPTPSNTPTPQ